jgi:chemotaxis protein CheX
VKVEYINHFLDAGVRVIVQLIGGEVELGQIAVRTSIFTTQQVSIAVGITGQLSGLVIYGMSQVTATKIASAIIGNQHVSFDAMAASAIGEMGNIISGNATMLMSKSGLHCNITPPSVIRGINVEIATAMPALVIPLYSKCGKIEVNVALAETLTAPEDVQGETSPAYA